MWICRSPWGFGADRPPFRNRVEKKRESRGERLQKSKAKEEASSRGVGRSEPVDELFEHVDLVPYPALERALVTTAAYSARYHWIGIYLLDGDELSLEVFRGDPCPYERIPRDKGITGAVVTSGKAEIIPDVTRESRYLSFGSGFRSAMVAPIRTAEGVVGAIDIESTDSQVFGDADLRFIESLAADLGRKIEAHRREVMRESDGPGFDDDDDEGDDE